MGRITEHSGWVVVDFRECGTRELFDVYREFGLLCAREAVCGALLKTGDEDADAHYTLRDVLVTVACIAGIPLHFRLALVATCEPIARVYRTVQRNLDGLGCDARVFCVESEAERWLRGDGESATNVRRGAAAGTASPAASSSL